MPDNSGLSRRALWAGGEPLVGVLMAKTLAHPEIVSLAAGFVDYQTLPVETTRKALEAIWSDPARACGALQYGTNAGHRPLREAILERMLAADGPGGGTARLTADRVVLTAGSNQLLFLVGDVLLDPGDIVLCGAPSYFVFLGTLGNLGARAFGIETDQDGMIPEALDAELARREAAGELGQVKLVYVTTYYDNPSSATLSAPRRAALVEVVERWSRRQKIYLVEDAAYRELRYYGEDIPSLLSYDESAGTVIHTGTFSKSFSPGVRVGWGILPPELVEPVLAEKGNLDFGSPNFNQYLMAAVMEMGLWEEHLRQLRAGYRVKIDAMLEAADAALAEIDGLQWQRPGGGLYVWLRLPEGLDAGPAGPLFDRAVEEGVLYVPGEYCYPAEGRGPKKNRIRLSFGIQSCESIRRGIEALGRAMRGVLRC